jgi:hypothetical protein
MLPPAVPGRHLHRTPGTETLFFSSTFKIGKVRGKGRAFSLTGSCNGPLENLEMSRILDLGAYRDRVAEEKAFGPWQKRFGESYGAETRVADLSDTTLFFLAKPGEEAAEAFYELIMGALNLGKAARFYYLDKTDQLVVVDRHLFLADQLRLELMHRLDWLAEFPGEGFTLLSMVKDFTRTKSEMKERSASLAESHPDYPEYKKLSISDRQIFLRRRLLNALQEFRTRLS